MEEFIHWYLQSEGGGGCRLASEGDWTELKFGETYMYNAEPCDDATKTSQNLLESFIFDEVERSAHL